MIYAESEEDNEYDIHPNKQIPSDSYQYDRHDQNGTVGIDLTEELSSQIEYAI
jgi:hypothetical protein